ncbi:MAG: hypothetical protein ACO1TE_28120 [Prosthecobacter sp.]
MNAYLTRPRSPATTVARLAAVISCANQMLDRRVQPPFTFEDLYEAADEGCLVKLLLQIDDHGLLAPWVEDPEARQELETALHGAALALEGREMSDFGIGDNALCLIIALALDAMLHPGEMRGAW